MVLAPEASLLPTKVKTAVALEPEAVKVAEPSEVCPSVNAMLPVGAALPDAGVTDIDNCGVAVGARLAGLAGAVRVVTTFAGAVTGTEAEPAEPANAVVPP